jgi:hypothetical protein
MPKLPPTGPDAIARYERVVEPFLGRGATKGKMFGMPIVKARDKVFAGTYGDAMTFKLGEDGTVKALRLKGVEAFEPMAGRAMKGWVLVPLGHAKRWPALAEQAWTFMTS